MLFYPDAAVDALNREMPQDKDEAGGTSTARIISNLPSELQLSGALRSVFPLESAAARAVPATPSLCMPPEQLA